MNLKEILQGHEYSIKHGYLDYFATKHVKAKLFKKAHDEEELQGVWERFGIYTQNKWMPFIEARHMFRCLPQFNGNIYEIRINGARQTLSENAAKGVYDEISKMYKEQEEEAQKAREGQEISILFTTIQKKLAYPCTK